jgi:Fe-S-cluster containining protein
MNGPEEARRVGQCQKCGTCCRKASPTLYEEDLAAVEQGHLPREELYSLRAGETVHSSRLEKDFVLDRDLLKVREQGSGGCSLLEDTLCSIYEHRPLQCRHLECWSDRHAGQLEAIPRLDRRALYASDETALALIREYDVKVDAARLGELLTAASRGDDGAGREALGLIDLDYRLRAGIADRYGYTEREQELLLGRPALAVSRAHGLEVAMDEEGEPVLRAAPGSSSGP